MAPAPRSKPRFFLHASANALGGLLETPQRKVIPSQASASLPEVGGHATTRTEAFNLDEIISCKAAYTRLTGSHNKEDGSWNTVVTSVVEGLNILDVVKAERIVAQVAVDRHADLKAPTDSLAGSHFDGLRLGGRDISLKLNDALHGVGSCEAIGWPTFQQVGHDQAVKIVEKAKAGKSAEWFADRFDWMTPKPKGDGCVLCSLVDGIDPTVPGRAIGHVLEIPHFGRIILGEMLVCPGSVQVSMIRAELGCTHTGSITAAMAHGGGGTVPPS
jgi:hypothetical protein